MSSPVLYGIRNCDTIKRARTWLDESGVDYRFHDYRADGCDAGQIARWCETLGWETLVNRRGTTWRKLDEDRKQGLDTEAAVALMCENPSLIKRPVLESTGSLLVGFDEEKYRALLHG